MPRLLLLALLCCASSLSAQAPFPWAGDWRLNVEKSTWGPVPAPYTRARWRIETADGQIRMIYDMVGTRGGVTHMEWLGRFDGRDYAMQGPDTIVSYAYTTLDERTLVLTVKVDGNVAATSRLVLSPDGRTLTTENVSGHPRYGRIETTTVYERR
jgi:hypothetical protein